MDNESVFLYNEVCPRCRKMGNDLSGDNLGVYSDDHAHCWACGFYRHGTINTRRRIYTPPKHIPIVLPDDCAFEYSQSAVKWMKQYGMTHKDLLRNNILWSEDGLHINLKGVRTQCKDMLIFPFWNKMDLLGYIGRYFGGIPRVPKWITRGKMQEIYHILPGKKDGSIVLTEDIVSAIKVAQVGHESMSVFGIQAKGRFKHLKLLGYSKVILWLDPDMHMEMIKQSRVGMLEGLEMHVVLSSKDPKCHSLTEIKEYLK